jgi:aspartate carbamoyltransferase catalytic subunit
LLLDIPPYPAHLLGIEGMKPDQISTLLDLANGYAESNGSGAFRASTLRGITVLNLFFENSTRTRTSFEIAGKRLGADVLNMALSASALSKGESLLDTAITLEAMQPDVLVVRHDQSGACRLLARKSRCIVVNAGDGWCEHPTQALIDALTIRRRIGHLAGLKVAICGDILHSRVARSNIQLLASMGAETRVVAPPTLLPADIDRFGAAVHHRMETGLVGCDVVMMLRLQIERMSGVRLPSAREYFHFYGLTEARLRAAAPGCLVMHPGPMNRGVEIDSDVADDITRSVIVDQVEMGVAVRMAVLDMVTRERRVRQEAA